MLAAKSEYHLAWRVSFTPGEAMSQHWSHSFGVDTSSITSLFIAPFWLGGRSELHGTSVWTRSYEIFCRNNFSNFFVKHGSGHADIFLQCTRFTLNHPSINLTAFSCAGLLECIRGAYPSCNRAKAGWGRFK